MKKTSKTNGTSANKANKACKVLNIGAPTKAEALKEAGAIKATENKEATKLAKAEAKAKQQARAERAGKIVGRIKAEALTLSGVLHSVWIYATELEEANELHKADALAIMADFKAVTGEDWPATRREFARLWLEAIHKYSKAVGENGKAVSTKAKAGYFWAVEFAPSLRSVWAEVVAGWVKQRTPLALVAGCYYTRNAKGEATKAKATEARQAIAEADKKAKAIAEAKAKAGEEARKAWAGEKAKAEA